MGSSKRMRTARGRRMGCLLAAGVALAASSANGQIQFINRSDVVGLYPDVYFGLSATDMDGDGYEDILHGRHQHAHPVITFNNGLGEFEWLERDIFTPGLDRDRHTGDCVDLDNDGDRDVYYGSGRQRPHELWINDGTGLGMTDIWLNLNPPYLTGNARSTVWFDWNNDGFLDVWMIVGRNKTYSKFGESVGGTGAFIDRTEEVGLYVFPLSGNSGCGLADYDFDGDVDFFLCNPSAGDYSATQDGRGKFYRRNADITFTNILETVLGENALYWSSSSRWGDYDNDGDMDLYLARGFWHRDYGESLSGDGINVLDPNKMELISRVNWADGDYADAWRINVAGATTVTLDIQAFRNFIPAPVLSTVFLGPNKINPTALPVVLDPSDMTYWGAPPLDASGVYFWFDRDGDRLQFRHRSLESAAARIAPAKHSVSEPVPAQADECCLASCAPTGRGSQRGGTGDSATFVTGYVLTDGAEIRFPLVSQMERAELNYPDMLFRNEGDGTFTDVTAQMGLGCDSVGVVASWSDLDNDGDLDLIVVNSHYDIPLNRPFVIYRNDYPGPFVEVTSEAGLTAELNSALTNITVADFDIDGYLDFVVSGESGPPPRVSAEPRYYVNAGGTNRWLEVRLVGTTSNRDAIGSKLWLTTDNGLQYREQMGGFHAFGQDSMIAHFGVADDDLVDLTIQWPMGGVQTLRDLPTNQRITVVEAPVAGDANGDADLDLQDFQVFQLCVSGSYDSQNFVRPWDHSTFWFRGTCMVADSDLDGDVDLVDLAQFEVELNGPH